MTGSAIESRITLASAGAQLKACADGRFFSVEGVDRAAQRPLTIRPVGYYSLVSLNLQYTFHRWWLMRLRFALAIISFLGTATMAQVRYFPTGSLSSNQRSDEFRAKRYSEQLKALKEPSLWESSKTQKTESRTTRWL